MIALSMRVILSFLDESSPYHREELLWGSDAHQRCCALQLFIALFTMDKGIDEEAILPRLHAFLVSLVKPQFHYAGPMDSPIEQFVFIRDVARIHRPRRVVSIAEDCAALSFAMKSIVFHQARIQNSKHATFCWYTLGGPHKADDSESQQTAQVLPSSSDDEDGISVESLVANVKARAEIGKSVS